MTEAITLIDVFGEPEDSEPEHDWVCCDCLDCENRRRAEESHCDCQECQNRRHAEETHGG